MSKKLWNKVYDNLDAFWFASTNSVEWQVIGLEQEIMLRERRQ